MKHLPLAEHHVYREHRSGYPHDRPDLTDAPVDAGQGIKRLEECCAGWKGEYINSVSISCGFADSKELSDIDSIEKAADERMYQAKRNYYISSGTDRRSR